MNSLALHTFARFNPRLVLHKTYASDSHASPSYLVPKHERWGRVVGGGGEGQLRHPSKTDGMEERERDSAQALCGALHSAASLLK